VSFAESHVELQYFVTIRNITR